MTERPDQSLAWSSAGTTLVQTTLDALSDAELAGASLLPDWSRAHVVAHLARNADALVNLLQWAQTGIETPMYPSAERRNADIEESARRPPSAGRADLSATCARLDAELAAMPDLAWTARVRTAQGRDIPASVVPWMRVREVWLHAVDLGGAATMADIPDDVLGAIVDDAAVMITGRGEGSSLVLVCTSDDRRWSVGVEGDPVEVRGQLVDLAGYLLRGSVTGSLSSSRAELPPAPRWL